MKKFEEGVFSDLRNLKPGVDACLEEPKVSTAFFADAAQFVRQSTTNASPLGPASVLCPPGCASGYLGHCTRPLAPFRHCQIHTTSLTWLASHPS
jgi:hypothetical protein